MQKQQHMTENTNLACIAVGRVLLVGFEEGQQIVSHCDVCWLLWLLAGVEPGDLNIDTSLQPRGTSMKVFGDTTEDSEDTTAHSRRNPSRRDVDRTDGDAEVSLMTSDMRQVVTQ